MTIVKRGNKFRVISEKSGKNLGEADTKAGAVKRLGQVEYFKHAKCIVDPTLVKDQKFQPVIFQGKDRALGNKPDKDFPSTPLAYDLKDAAQPEFPSAPFSGQPYAQSFSNPTAGQGNDPDIQHKGSDYHSSHSAVIGDFASVQPADGSMEFNSTGRGRNLIQPAVDLKEGHVKPIKRARSIRESSMSNTNSGGQTSDMSRSVRIAGTNIIFKQQLNDFNYPIDRGSNTRIDPEEEAQKRKAIHYSEKLKQKQKEYNEHRENIARDKDYDSYLGRAKDSKPIGEYTKEYPGAKVTFNQPIDPTKKPKKVFTHLTSEGQDIHLKRQNKAIKAIMYTQNQPLDASLKPIMKIEEKKKARKSFSTGTTLVGVARNLGSTDKTSDFARVAREKAAEVEAEQSDPIVSKEITDEESRQETKKSFNPPHSYNPDRPNKIKGGIGDKLKPKDVDDTQLVAGINVEQEHVGKDENKTEDEKRDMAQDIALDHLKEDKDYYTKLNEMERHGKAVKKEETKKKKLLRISKNEVGKSIILLKTSKVSKERAKEALKDVFLTAPENTTPEKKEVSQYYFHRALTSRLGGKPETYAKKVKKFREESKKSVVSLEDFKQYKRNTGKLGPTKHPEKEIPGFSRPYSVTQAEGRKPADVHDIKTREKLND